MAETSASSGAGDRQAWGADSDLSRRQSSAAVLTFLFADVRGYTRFTQEHGDEAAAELAARFGELARETARVCGAESIELAGGDEALCVFESARRAFRAAVALQTVFRARTDDEPAFPLPIGIGLDAGEAVPLEGGHRGGALNTAARLCSLARPGEILATETVVNLASRLEGIRFEARRPVRLKGLERPVRVIEVVSEAPLPPVPEIEPRKRPLLTTRRLAIGAVAGAALIAAVVALVVVRSSGPDYLPRLSANAIGSIDDGAAGIASEKPLRSAPSAIAAGNGVVWAASEADGTVARFDPDSGNVDTLPFTGSPSGVAYGAGWLWVASRDGRGLVQINPRTSKTVQTFDVGNGPGGVAVGKDAVWVANVIDRTVSRVGLADGSVAKPIPVTGSPSGIAAGARAVWVATDAGVVYRIDPATRMIADDPIPVGHDPTGVAVGAGSVWVTNTEDGTVSRIDPATDKEIDRIPVGGSPSAVVAGPDEVWVADGKSGTMTRIDPRTGEPSDPVPLGSSPSALASGNGKVWVASLPARAGHRGGVLRVEVAPVTLDYMVPGPLYDGLVTYRRVHGAAGGTLVPDLVVHLPTPTDGGKTYTFQLRKGIRYSDGRTVRASDFRTSIERLLSMTPWAILGPGIVGAAKCVARPNPGTPCGLSRGIDADNSTGTITVHLTKPDPQFLYRLASLESAVVAPRAPKDAPSAWPAGTGPYRIASFGPHEIRLVRNEHFKPWSAEARPDGYPDEIRFLPNSSGNARVKAVEQGAADWAPLNFSGLTAARLRGVLTRYANRLHVDPAPTTMWYFLNTRVPPFDDVRVRRALNYAIDREAVAALWGSHATPTCQILPPSMSAYRPYCPYTRSPNRAGRWIAPDLAKARALVAASGTAGMRIVLISPKDKPVPRQMGLYIGSVLRQLGYRASLREMPAGKTFGYIGDSRNRAQIGSSGWYAGNFAPFDFLQQVFACNSFVPRSPNNNNWFEYCDRRLDATMTKAGALQATDLPRADELWASADRSVVDQAVALPLLTPQDANLVSRRVGNYQSHPLWGTLFDQLWVK